MRVSDGPRDENDEAKKLGLSSGRVVKLRSEGRVRAWRELHEVREKR